MFERRLHKHIFCEQLIVKEGNIKERVAKQKGKTKPTRRRRKKKKRLNGGGGDNGTRGRDDDPGKRYEREGICLG